MGTLGYSWELLLLLYEIGGKMLALFSFFAPSFFLNFDIVALKAELSPVFDSTMEELLL